MVDDSKLFRLRENEIRYLKKILLQEESKFFNEYGSDYKKILMTAEDSETKADYEEWRSINYILQRADLVLSEYEKEKAKKESIL